MTESSIPDRVRTYLHFPSGESAPVADENDLLKKLENLPAMNSGETIRQYRNDNDYIMATRRSDLWSVVTRRGRWWTLASFTAEMTTDHSNRRAKGDRAAKTLWRRIAHYVALPPPEEALSAEQVRTVFVEYLLGKPFSIPKSGA